MYKAKGEFFTQALLFDSLRFPPVVWWINSTVLHWQLLSRRPESCREKHFSKLDSDGFFALLRSLSYVIKAIVAIYMYLEKNIWCLSYSLRMKNCIWILDCTTQFGPFSSYNLLVLFQLLELHQLRPYNKYIRQSILSLRVKRILYR